MDKEISESILQGIAFYTELHGQSLKDGYYNVTIPEKDLGEILQGLCNLVAALVGYIEESTGVPNVLHLVGLAFYDEAYGGET